MATGYAVSALRTHAASVSLVTRHASTLLACAAHWADESSASVVDPLIAAVALWAAYRLVTRSPATGPALVDVVAVLAVAAVVPLHYQEAAIFGPAQAVALVGVATLSVQYPLRWSVSVVVPVGAAYAIAIADLYGWSAALRAEDVWGITVAWLSGVGLRAVIGRMAAVVDASYRDRVAALVEREAAVAVDRFGESQRAALHDTVAATLVMLAHADRVPVGPLRARIARDLDVLSRPVPSGTSHPRLTGATTTAPIELVAALRAEATRHHTTITVTGEHMLPVAGDVAEAVLGVVTEALNNVDRHALARGAVVTVSDATVSVADDGAGFDTAATTAGHGLRRSIHGRMAAVGGSATVESGRNGTRVTAHLPSGARPVSVPDLADEADRTIWRCRRAVGLCVVAYTMVQLLTTAPWGVADSPDLAASGVLGAGVVVGALSGLYGILTDRWWSARLGAVAVVGVVAVQPFLDRALGITGPGWAAAAAGFALIPLLLRHRFRYAAAALVALWSLPVSLELLRSPDVRVAAALTCAASVYLAAQLSLCALGVAMRVAAQATCARYRDLLAVDRERRVAAATRAEYDRRFAAVVARAIALLAPLRDGAAVTDAVRDAARRELREVRALFDSGSAPGPHRRGAGGDDAVALRSAIARAEARGVVVTAEVDDGATTTAIVDAVVAALDDASDHARVVVSTIGGSPSGSVVHGVTPDAPAPDHPAGVEVITAGATRWVSVGV